MLIKQYPDPSRVGVVFLCVSLFRWEYLVPGVPPQNVKNGSFQEAEQSLLARQAKPDDLRFVISIQLDQTLLRRRRY